jgi:D-sedoheptulose 7-phosphate isomerase
LRVSTKSDEVILGALVKSLSLHQALLEDQKLIETLGTVAEEMIGALTRGHKLFFFGNGGSAADAQHLAAELVGRYERERRALPALALTVDTSALTAIGNDYSFEKVFTRQLEALGSRGDVAVGISTSGKSPNVLHAIRSAKKMGLLTVAFTGAGGGALAGLADHCICVPSGQTARVQEAHILVGHILCELIDEKFAADPDVSP